MCGITGFFTLSSGTHGNLEATVSAMVDTLLHRGPDDSGVWSDPEAGVALGQRRLSILDLSPLGHQPMFSACGRYVLVYNGEVYNFKELRAELVALGHAFKGGSDTEVLLAAMAQWGVRPAVERCIGMFAFALWDRKERYLTLGRDRLGIKPLYYGWQGRTFLFGSELKSLRAHPDFQPDLDRHALSLYFRHNYVPSPHSIYADIHKLEPGCILTISADGEKNEPKSETYWSARQIWEPCGSNLFSGRDEEAIERLEFFLDDAVRRRMIADVPLGAFLSGGIDSSTVVALMQAAGNRPVKTFSIGFDDPRYNEAAHAKAVAAYLGTEHTELYVTPGDLLEVVPDIAHFWDEPFADASQIPTTVVSRLARQHVTVSLSGDGGDELFAGYDRYFWTQRLLRLLRIPRFARQFAAGCGKLLPESVYRLLGPKGPRIRWRLDLLSARDIRELYLFLVSHFKHPDSLVLHGDDGCILQGGEHPDKQDEDIFRILQLWDIETYLPDDILTKVDRASMSVSLEARVPILDHRVVEFAAALPVHLKVRNGQGKWLLRQVLSRHVPDELMDRPKMGFAVPIEHWLRNELRDWAEALLDESTVHSQGWLDAGLVRRIWKDYLGGQGNWYYCLWDILMFQSWLEKNGR